MMTHRDPPQPDPTKSSPPSSSISISLSTFLPLLHEALAKEGRFVLPLAGTSMRPTLPVACRVEIVPLPAQPDTVALGSLIVFAVGDALITHRLVARRPIQGTLHWIAQGDGRRAADAPLLPGQVLGQVVRAMDDKGQTVWPGPGAKAWAAWWIVRHHGLARLRPLWRWVRRWMRRWR
ncbi:MAG: S24/S26 family peptidase [Caldilineaceae bacterium]|nr:S24/S26 family peptidase [Caldilineaceae bacterium]MBP8124200.1 S24/S26 family peptidase [Caldilineaceae bacterium]MBP9071326.1 S24/S26 family peptidase [Caldilineaceae bacterium]